MNHKNRIAAAVMVLSVCMLTACGSEISTGSAVSETLSETLTETEIEAKTSAEAAENEKTGVRTETESKTPAELNEVITGTDPLDTAAAFIIESPEPDEKAVAEAAKRPEITDYKLNYTGYEFADDAQRALAEYLYANWNEEQMRIDIEGSRAYILAYDPERQLGDCDVYNREFCADFDGDGDNELFVYRYVNLDERSSWAMYRDLWYTDGENVKMLYYGIGRAAFSGIFEVQDGVPLMFIVPDIVMGSPIQTAYCVSAADGTPKWYELPEDRCFMYDFIFESEEVKKDFLFIYDSDFDYSDFSKAEGDDLENFQQIGWVDGKLEIVSGYGAGSE